MQLLLSKLVSIYLINSNVSILIRCEFNETCSFMSAIVLLEQIKFDDLQVKPTLKQLIQIILGLVIINATYVQFVAILGRI